jgi:putative salt-induced outer membrane protein YdiY
MYFFLRISVFSLLFFLSFNLFSQEKTFSMQLKSIADTLVLKNRDQLVGKVDKMENAVLTIETDYSESDFQIKWHDIEKISIFDYSLIILSSGERLIGALHTPSPDSAAITLLENDSIINVLLSQISVIQPVTKSIFSRFDASLSLGYNFTKSNNLSQLSIRSTLGYTDFKWNFSGGFNTVTSTQDNADPTKRTDANLGGKYLLQRNLFIPLNSNFLSNEEQKLKLRSSIKGGLGKFFVRTNKLYFGTALGLGWNNEQYNDSSGTNRNSVEAFLGAEFNMFDFKNVDLLFNIVAYPNLTEAGRIRTDSNLDFKFDLPLEFFLKAGITLNYDNKPVQGASSTDYVIQTTFGWEL